MASDFVRDSPALLGALVVAATGLVYLYSTWTYSVFKKIGVTGPRPWPLIGNMGEILKTSIPDVDVENRARYGRVYGVFYGRTPFLAVTDLDMVKEITVKEFSHFTNHATQGIRQPKPLDRMLTVIHDDHWRHVRNTLTPTFTSGKLKQMLPTILDCSTSLVDHIERCNGTSQDVKNIMAAYTMDVIAGTAFGLKVDSLQDDQHPFLKHARHFFLSATQPSLKTYFLLTLFLTLPKLGKLLMSMGLTIFDRNSVVYIERVVEEAMEQRIEREGQKDFVQLCIDHRAEVDVNDKEHYRLTEGLQWTTRGLTKGDIVSNAVVFLLAGYEPTSFLLTYFFYAMAAWPVVQEKVQAEIDAVLGEVTDPSYDSLKQLAYLDQCFDEVLRMYPPLTRLDRECNKDTIVNGIHIPKGMVVTIPVYALHHDPEIWPNPDQFDPERFEASEKAKRHSCAWLPFGIGPRNCIGMRLALLEAKVAAAKTLQRYTVHRVAETPAHPLKWKAMTGMVTPQDPIMLRFVKRASLISDRSSQRFD